MMAPLCPICLLRKRPLKERTFCQPSRLILQAVNHRQHPQANLIVRVWNPRASKQLQAWPTRLPTLHTWNRKTSRRPPSPSRKIPAAKRTCRQRLRLTLRPRCLQLHPHHLPERCQSRRLPRRGRRLHHPVPCPPHRPVCRPLRPPQCRPLQRALLPLTCPTTQFTRRTRLQTLTRRR